MMVSKDLARFSLATGLPTKNVEKEVKLSEIQHFFETKKAAIAAIEKDDITEIIGGPFKGEKGRVQRIDKVKDEVTVELLEASIPIPVTISTELIKLIKKGKREEAKNE
jgi:transcriptional antiterminator NusG